MMFRMGSAAVRKSAWGRLAAVALLPAVWGGVVVERSVHAQVPAAAQNAVAANQQFASAAALHNRQAWDLAADEWAKFIKDFAADERVSLARHYLGVCRLQLKDYAGAGAVFKELITANPKFEQIASSKLYLGMAQFNAGQQGKAELFAAAEKTLAAALKDHAEGKQVPQTVYYLAESLYAQDKKKEAEPLYARFTADFADDVLAPDALYAYGVVLEELGKSEEARAAYAEFVKRYPENGLRMEVDVRRADLLAAAGDAAAAEPLFAAAAQSADYPDADYALLRQAGCRYDQKQFAAAADSYEALLTRFPKSEYRTVAQLAAGRNRYFAGEWEAAARLLGPLASGSGETAAEAAHWTARALLKNKRPADAEQVLKAALKEKGKNKYSAQLALDLGDAMYDQDGRRADALKAYQALVEQYPDDALAAQGRYFGALTALELGKNGDARKLADAYLKQNASGELTSDVLYIKAESLLRDEKHSEAAAAYDQLLAADARHADRGKWLVRRAYALAAAGRHGDVVKSLASTVDGLEDAQLASEARQLLGVSRQATKDYTGAIADLETSLKLAPKRSGADDALLALAESQRLAGDAAAAEASIDRLATEFPESRLLDSAFYRRGESAYAAGNFAAADKAYRRVIADYPKSPLVPYARYGLAWASLGSNDPATAAAALDDLLKQKTPGELTAKAHYARALAFEQLKKYQPAIEDLNLYLKTKPTGNDRSEALYWLGRCQLGLNDTEAALKTFGELLAGDAKYAGTSKVLYEVGWLHKTAGRPKESAAAFARLAKEFPQSPQAAESLFHVGEEAYARKDYTAAIDAFYDAREKAESKELAEKSAYNLGWTYFHKENFPKAEEWFRYQTNQHADGTLVESARFMLAEALFKQKKYDEALAAYRDVKDVKEPDFQVLTLLHGGQCAEQLEDWKGAQALLDSAAEKFPKSTYLPEINYERAWVRQNLGDKEGALKLYEEVTTQTQDVTAARARFMIGEIYFLDKNHTEAVRHFFKAAYGYGYPEWQARSHFEAARCFEVLGKLDQAKKSYEEIVKNFDKFEEAGLAKKRLEELNRSN